MKRVLLSAVLAAPAFVAGYYLRGRAQDKHDQPQAAARKILYWYDAMHPWYRSDKPGIAPDCGMQLTPRYADEPDQPFEHPQSHRKILTYRDPQDPSYTSDKPGLNPETGNELMPVYADAPEAMPPGTIHVSAERQQLIGVEFGTAELTSEPLMIRAAGRVVPDETRVYHAHTRIEGWIEDVHVHYTGQFVKQGDPLFTVYSPELLATQQEYLLALKAKEELKGASLRHTGERMDSLIEAARRRLLLLNVTEEQIGQIRSTGKPLVKVTVFSPATGYVTKRNAFHSMQVKPEMELYEIVDLSRVWILADVFESDLPFIRLGMPARLETPAVAGRTLSAQVSYIQPNVDPTTRTVKVRLEAANPSLALKPDMYVDVHLHAARPPHLTVPVNAVLDAGQRKTVFVDRGNGFFEPRRVETGERYGGRVVILSGLRPGERIVTSGTFLLDSESQLQTALSEAGRGHAHASAPAHAPERRKSAPGEKKDD